MVAAELTMSARDVLAEHERIIEESLGSFTVTGAEMRAIRADRSYRDDYGSWEAYLIARCENIGGRSYVNRVIAATEVVETVAPRGAIAPATEKHARPLTKLSRAHQPVAWGRVLDAVGTAPEKITERLVRDIVEAYRAELSRIDEDDDPDTTALPRTRRVCIVLPLTMYKAVRRLPVMHQQQLCGGSARTGQTYIPGCWPASYRRTRRWSTPYHRIASRPELPRPANGRATSARCLGQNNGSSASHRRRQRSRLQRQDAGAGTIGTA